MLNCLSGNLENFPGAANQTRCFAHTVSIAAKSIIQQFDAPRSKSSEVDDEAAEALAALYEGLEVEERQEREERLCNEDEDGDNLLNARETYQGELTDEQRAKQDASIQPVRTTLAKVVISY